MKEVEVLKQIIHNILTVKTDCIFYVASYDLKFRCCKCSGTLYVKGEDDNTMCKGCRLWDNYIPQSATEEEKIKALRWQSMSLMDQPDYYDYF